MDPFSTLGLPRRYEVDMPQLETSYRELQKALHPDRHAGASASQRRMSLVRAVEVSEALGEAKQAKDLPRVRRMAAEIAERQAQARAALVGAFDALPVTPSAA